MRRFFFLLIAAFTAPNSTWILRKLLYTDSRLLSSHNLYLILITNINYRPTPYSIALMFQVAPKCELFILYFYQLSVSDLLPSSFEETLQNGL